MKKLLYLLFVLFSCFSSMAQGPASFNYQAVIRDGSGKIMVNEQVTITLDILTGNLIDSLVYSEVWDVETNPVGLVNLEIGLGDSISFARINWSHGPYFIAVSINGELLGKSQLVSVPYALHAKTADSVRGGISEIDPAFKSSSAANITASDITNLENLSGVNTGDQDLSNYVTIEELENTESELEDKIPSVRGFIKKEVDGSISNELQVLSISNDTIFLSDGGNVKLPAGSGFDGDFTSLTSVPANLDTDVTDDFDGQYSSLSGAPANVSTFTNDAGYLTSEDDDDATNEIQAISENELTVTLSKGGGTFTDSVNVYTAGNGIEIENNEISVAEDTDTLYIGKLHQGGIIFYINPNGEGGLILSREDMSDTDGNTAHVWTNEATKLIEVPERGALHLFDGKNNTDAIVFQAGDGDYAAKLCRDYAGGGFNDWYLPSIMELKEFGNVIYIIYDVMSKLGDIPEGMAYSESDELRLWSSTEYYNDSRKARYYHAADGRTSESLKNETYRVRAIRKF